MVFAESLESGGLSVFAKTDMFETMTMKFNVLSLRRNRTE